MSYSTAKWMDLGADTDNGVFSMGYIDNTPNLYLPQGASPYLRNARLDGNTVCIRPGHRLAISTTDVPKGIGTYLRKSEVLDTIVVRENADTDKKIVKYNLDGTRTPVETGANITSDNKMRFINVADTVYCMNGVDRLGKLVGDTYSLGITNITPAFGTVFNGCMWIAGGGVTANVVRKSSGGIYNGSGQLQTGTYDDFGGSGSDTFTFEENITGLYANSQALFYFTKNTVSVTGHTDIETVEISGGGSRVAYTNSVLAVKEGAVNHDGIVGVGNDVYYITPSNRICKIYRGNNINGYEVQDLSGRKYAGCEELLNSLDKDQSECWGYYLPTKDLIKWFFKSKGSHTYDICIIYDVSKDKFLVDTGKYFSGGISFKGGVYTTSQLEPKMYEDEVGTEDEDMPIAFEYWTKEFYISDPTFKKIFWETRTTLDINPNAELYQEIWVDESQVDVIKIDKGWLDLGVANGGIGTFATSTAMVGVDIEADTYVDELMDKELYVLRTKGNLNVRGHKIQFRYRNTSEGAKVRLKYLSCKCEILPELTNRLR